MTSVQKKQRTLSSAGSLSFDIVLGFFINRIIFSLQGMIAPWTSNNSRLECNPIKCDGMFGLCNNYNSSKITKLSNY